MRLQGLKRNFEPVEHKNDEIIYDKVFLNGNI